MALYAYEALSKEGKRVRGVIDAPSAGSVKNMLAKQGLFPVSITRAQEGSQLRWWQRWFSRAVTPKEVVLFTRQFAVLLKSGTPLLQSLELLTDQFTGRLRTILVQMKDDVKEGSSLADALQKYPAVFDTIYVQLVRAGEASGKLETILDRLTSYLERRISQAKELKKALMMPTIQLVVAGLVIVVLLVKVIPEMTSFLSDQGGELPGPTRALMRISVFVQSYYLMVGAVLVVSYLLFSYWRKTPGGARAIDRVVLRLPLIKYIVKTRAVVQFSYTLGVLLDGGVNIAEALDIVCGVVDNQTLAHTLRQARQNIIKEGKIAEYLNQTGLFPPIAIYLIRTGEESGKLAEMLLVVARNYEEELQEQLGRLTALIGPFTMIIMAVVVGCIVVAVVLPMLNVGAALDGGI